ncbi:MAG TPA: hypothetical protein VMM56_14775 [Planctomycetaceae bacterium]|nr:hypothetical protein [Planctomycetaceae bacterium]
MSGDIPPGVAEAPPMSDAPSTPDEETWGAEGAELELLEEDEDVDDESELSPPPQPGSIKIKAPETEKARTEVSVDDFMDDDPSDTGNWRRTPHRFRT